MAAKNIYILLQYIIASPSTDSTNNPLAVLLEEEETEIDLIHALDQKAGAVVASTRSNHKSTIKMILRLIRLTEIQRLSLKRSDFRSETHQRTPLSTHSSSSASALLLSKILDLIDHLRQAARLVSEAVSNCDPNNPTLRAKTDAALDFAAILYDCSSIYSLLSKIEEE
jgi:hypothetical protein